MINMYTHVNIYLIIFYTYYDSICEKYKNVNTLIKNLKTIITSNSYNLDLHIFYAYNI